MITCPFCGTQYEIFQPNCKNCGGMLPKVQPETHKNAIQYSDSELPAPPPAPRSISFGYAWKLFFRDGWGVTSIIVLMFAGFFLFLGKTFSVVFFIGSVGVSFASVGVFLFSLGLILGIWRYIKKTSIVKIIKFGDAQPGKILSVEENYSVTVNNRHPWVITYDYVVNGRLYEGKVSTLARPGFHIQPGNDIYVLYLAEDPQNGVLFPYP